MGLAPLSYPALAAWARLMDVALEPHEAEALMVLDAVMRCPGESEPAEPEERPSVPVWPTRKAG